MGLWKFISRNVGSATSASKEWWNFGTTEGSEIMKNSQFGEMTPRPGQQPIMSNSDLVPKQLKDDYLLYIKEKVEYEGWTAEDVAEMRESVKLLLQVDMQAYLCKWFANSTAPIKARHKAANDLYARIKVRINEAKPE